MGNREVVVDVWRASLKVSEKDIRLFIGPFSADHQGPEAINLVAKVANEDP